MNIYRKICVVFSNLNDKLIRGIKLKQKKIYQKKFGKIFVKV